MQRYKCYLCKAEVDLSKRRVKCFNCSKMALVPIEELPQETVSVTGKTKRKGEPIFKGNTFVDDLTKCVEDRSFTKKVKFSVSPREERKKEFVTKRCSVCAQDFETKFPRETRCTKCCRG